MTGTAFAGTYPDGEPETEAASPATYRFASPSEGSAALEAFLEGEAYAAATDAEISLSYGQALLDANDPREARQVLRCAYKRLRRADDSEQVHTAEILVAQAKVDYHLGRLTSRRRALKKAYRSYSEALGKSAETTLMTRLDYAEALLQEGYYELAYAQSHHGFYGHHTNVYRFGRAEAGDVAEAARAALGALDPTTLRAELIHASSSLKTGYYNAAEEALLRIIASTRLGAAGQEGESALLAREYLIELYVACDRGDEATPYEAELEAFAKDQPGADNDRKEDEAPPSMYDTDANTA